jgi:hypothetical protein
MLAIFLRNIKTMKQQKFNWICKIIESCIDAFHFECVDKLIELFHEQEKDEEFTSELKLIKKMYQESNIIK